MVDMNVEKPSDRQLDQQTDLRIEPRAYTEAPARRSLRRLMRNRMAMVGLTIILVWVLLAVFAPLITAYGPLEQKLSDRLDPPSRQHFFGTDELGRDVYSRVLYGARISVPVGLLVIGFSLMVGSVLGAISGYFGGAADLLIMRVADITLAFPTIVLALAIAAVLGPDLKNALIAMIVVWWPEYARMMRGQVLTVKNQEYVIAAEVIGARWPRILFHHIIPNTVTPLIVKASLDAGTAILTIAALSFIGVGAVPPTPEWGAMISAGRYKFTYWWITGFPGLAMLTIVMGLNFLGDGVRDAFDPRMREI
jgi:peptide/nickel transport system permease protein